MLGLSRILDRPRTADAATGGMGLFWEGVLNGGQGNSGSPCICPIHAAFRPRGWVASRRFTGCFSCWHEPPSAAASAVCARCGANMGSFIVDNPRSRAASLADLPYGLRHLQMTVEPRTEHDGSFTGVHCDSSPEKVDFTKS